MERLVACTSLARLRHRDVSDVSENSDHHLSFLLQKIDVVVHGLKMCAWI